MKNYQSKRAVKFNSTQVTLVLVVGVAKVGRENFLLPKKKSNFLVF
jgi:hypothetical protein